MEKFPDPDYMGNVGAYLQTSIVHQSIDEFKKSINNLSDQEGLDFESFQSHDQTEQIVFNLIRDELLLKAISELPEEYVATMLLLSHGYAFKEIAEQLSVPLGTVCIRVKRAKEKLKGQNLFR